MLPKLLKRQCWKCGRTFLRAGQMLRCGRCSVKYDNGMLPYSPLYTGPRHKPRDARMVLDAAYCFSIGVPCDAAQHLAGMSHKVAESLYENFKTVTAVAEYVICMQSCFEDSAWCIAQQNRCKVISGAFAYSRGDSESYTAPKLMMMLRMTLLLMRVMTMMIPLSLCSTGRVGGETTRTEAQRNPA